jgi:hypothetical protein
MKILFELYAAVATVSDLKVFSRRYRCGLHFVHGLQYW